jgi:hypothetical protein
VDAIDRAHVYAGVVLGADAWIGDYERHYVELTQKCSGGETTVSHCAAAVKDGRVNCSTPPRG